MYFGDHPVSAKWGLHLEGQYRRHDFGRSWQQLLLRPGVNYSVSKRLMLTAGYGYIRTHRYGEYPVVVRFPEHRIFQQALVKHSAGKVDFAHRFRVEQRWMGEVRPVSLALERWRRQDRFRYMFRFTVPLHQENKWYLAVYDEILVHFRKNYGASAYDHNRAYVALGRRLGKPGNLEIGYMNQYLLQRNGQIRENNHTFQLAFFSTFPFHKK